MLRAEMAELRQDFRAMVSRPTNFTLDIDAATFKMPEYPATPAPITNVAAPDFRPLEKAMEKLASAIASKECKVVVKVEKPDPAKIDVHVPKPDPVIVNVDIAPAQIECKPEIIVQPARVEIPKVSERPPARDAEIEFDRDGKKATIKFV